MTAPSKRRLRDLRLRYAAGEDLELLAAEVGSNVGTLRWWWRESGINTEIAGRRRARREWDPDLLRSLRLRFLDGEAIESLAEVVEASPSALTAAWSRFGIARELPLDNFRRHDWTMAQLRAIAARWMAGESLAAISREIEVNPSSLTGALERAGFKTPEAAERRRSAIRSRRHGEAIRAAYVLRRDTTATWKEIAERVEWEGSPVTLRTYLVRWCERNRMPRPPKRSRTGRVIG